MNRPRTDRTDDPVTVVIPARFASSRFPGKPLALLGGKPLIQQVYERVATVPEVATVLVATDDPRILETVRGFGGSAMLLDGAFRTGTDRVAALARAVPGNVFVNVQGDEIILHPGLLTDLIVPFLQSEADIGTLKRRLAAPDEIRNSSVVKVVTDVSGAALYFSRAPIPHIRDGEAGDFAAALYYIHLGIYIYRREALMRFADLPTSPLEEAEKLEQLRALEHGMRIMVWETSHPSLRVDDAEDLTHAGRVLMQHHPQAKVAL